MKKIIVVFIAVLLLFFNIYSFAIFQNTVGIGPDPFWGDTAQNNQICTVTGDRTNPQIISPRQGWAMIVWQDERNDTGDIYIQLLNVDGENQWEINGTIICNATNTQSDPQMIHDGSGGAIIVWQDERTDVGDIYAQRIAFNGSILWTINGTTICSANNQQLEPQLVSDGTGGAIISWEDRRNDAGDIYAQRINSTGTVQWTSNGVVICNAANQQKEVQLVEDGSGGAVIVWRDNRGSDSDIYTQKVDGSGNTQWAGNGVTICNAGFQQKDPQLVSNGAGGVIVSWEDFRSGTKYKIFAQAVDSSGNVLWTANGKKICSAINAQENVHLINDSMGGAIFTWQDERNGLNTYDVYAQRINDSGDLLWSPNGTSICNATSDQTLPKIVSDNQGGAFICWLDARNGGANTDIYAQRINETGVGKWTLNGTPICNATGKQLNPQLASTSQCELFAVWQDDRNINTDIYSHRFGSVIITRSPLEVVDEDSYYVYDFDSNVQGLWRIDTDASWLTFNTSTGELSGIPNNLQVGNYYLNVKFEDIQKCEVWYNYTLKVNNVPPRLTGTPPATALEDSKYEIDFHSDDDGQGIVTWSVITNADWLMFDDSTVVLSGTPRNNDVGNYFVEINIRDSHGGISIYNYSLQVNNVNDPPVITTSDNTMAIEDEQYNVDYDALDIDPVNDELYWSVFTNSSWLKINNDTGNLSGIPRNDNVGITDVKIIVEDGNGGSDFNEFTIQVVNVNDPPIIITDHVEQAFENKPYYIDYDAVDIDPTNDQLTLNWSMNTNANWLSINNTTGEIWGTPTDHDVGTYFVTILVTDRFDASDNSSFQLEVINVNNLPKIITIDEKIAFEDSYYTVDYDATDIDSPIEQFNWYLNTNAKWLKINSKSGLLSGLPANKDVGTFWVNITINDGDNGIQWHNFTISVKNVNDPPTITTDDIISTLEDVPYKVNYNATDIDPTNDELFWTLESNANWLTIDPVTGVLFGIPTNDYVGHFWISVLVSDGNGGEDRTSFMLTVLNQNDEPIIEPVTPLKGSKGQTYLLSMVGSDIDEDKLTWSLATNASWLSFDNNTGTLWGTPQVEGTFWVLVTVVDGQGGFDGLNLTIRIGSSVGEKNGDDDESGSDPDYSNEKNMLYASIIILVVFLLIISILIFMLLNKFSSFSTSKDSDSKEGIDGEDGADEKDEDKDKDKDKEKDVNVDEDEDEDVKEIKAVKEVKEVKKAKRVEEIEKDKNRKKDKDKDKVKERKLNKSKDSGADKQEDRLIAKLKEKGG